jgi:hypothetical protein
MKLHLMKRPLPSRLGRVLCIFLSLLLIVMGTAHIWAGPWGRKNYWGEVIFAPFGILVGLLLLYAAVFHWDRLQKPRQDKNGTWWW